MRAEAADFQQKAAQEDALEGAAVNEAIGQAPADAVKARRDAIEKPAIANHPGGKAAEKRPASRWPTSSGTCA